METLLRLERELKEERRLMIKNWCGYRNHAITSWGMVMTIQFFLYFYIGEKEEKQNWLIVRWARQLDWRERGELVLKIYIDLFSIDPNSGGTSFGGDSYQLTRVRGSSYGMRTQWRRSWWLWKEWGPWRHLGQTTSKPFFSRYGRWQAKLCMSLLRGC